MSLSQPKNPIFITEGVGSDKPSTSNLDANQNATLINQLHGINTTNATGAGIPKQVSKVQVSVANAQTGSTCTVSILFSQDPTDKNFAGIAVLIKGYQGNQQLVQVSSGISSPTKFVLNNTGETVSFTIQAYGNGGAAPLTGAPTCSAVLPKSTGGGFGSSTTTSAPGVTFQTQGVNNLSQLLLNLKSSDSTVNLTNSGGDVDFSIPIRIPNMRAWKPTPNSSSITANLGLGAASASGALGVSNSIDDAGGGFVNGVTLDTTTTAGHQVLLSFSGAVGFGIQPNRGQLWTTQTLKAATWSVRLIGTITNFRVWFGMVNIYGSNLTNMAADNPSSINLIGFRYSTAASDTHWKAVCQTPSGQTVVDTGVVVGLAEHNFSIVVVSTSQIKFYIDDVLVATISTNIPTSTTFMGDLICDDNVGLGNSRVAIISGFRSLEN